MVTAVSLWACALGRTHSITWRPLPRQDNEKPRQKTIMPELKNKLNPVRNQQQNIDQVLGLNGKLTVPPAGLRVEQGAVRPVMPGLGVQRSCSKPTRKCATTGSLSVLAASRGGRRLTRPSGSQAGGSVHCWLAPVLQSQISRSVPLAPNPVSSRQRPDCGLTSEPLFCGCQTWAQYFRRSTIST